MSGTSWEACRMIICELHDDGDRHDTTPIVGLIEHLRLTSVRASYASGPAASQGLDESHDCRDSHDCHHAYNCW